MAMYEVVRKARGKEEVVAEGSLSKMNHRRDQLRSSTSGGRVTGRGKRYSVEYSVRPKTADLDRS